jgi:hypothetical protein
MEFIEIEWQTIDTAIGKLVSDIQASGEDYTALYGIPRGGLIAAVMLSHRLDVPLLMSMEDVMLFQHQGRKVLVVDDISDSGKTLIAYRDTYDIATVCVREHTTETQPRFKGFSVNHDKWLVFPWETKKEAMEK